MDHSTGIKRSECATSLNVTRYFYNYLTFYQACCDKRAVTGVIAPVPG
jgi:site-specific recombinase XerC